MHSSALKRHKMHKNACIEYKIHRGLPALAAAQSHLHGSARPVLTTSSITHFHPNVYIYFSVEKIDADFLRRSEKYIELFAEFAIINGRLEYSGKYAHL